MTEHQCPLCHGRGRILSDKLVKYQPILKISLGQKDWLWEMLLLSENLTAVKVLQTAATTTSAATNVISEVLNQ